MAAIGATVATGGVVLGFTGILTGISSACLFGVTSATAAYFCYEINIKTKKLRASIE